MTALQSWMTLHDKTDDDVAAAVGCDRSHVVKLRTGVRQPSRELAAKLEDLTAVPWHKFIDPKAKVA